MMTKFGIRQCSNCHYFRSWNSEGKVMEKSEMINTGSCLYNPPQIYHGLNGEAIDLSWIGTEKRRSDKAKMPHISPEHNQSFVPITDATSFCSKHEWALAEQRKIMGSQDNGPIGHKPPSGKSQFVSIVKVIWKWLMWPSLIFVDVWARWYFLGDMCLC